jgi:hypothetical protein
MSGLVLDPNYIYMLNNDCAPALQESLLIASLIMIRILRQTASHDHEWIVALERSRIKFKISNLLVPF